MCSKYRDAVWHWKSCEGNLPLEISNSVYLKVDVAVLQPVGTSLVEEVDVFYEQAEERDDNLQGNGNRKGFNISEQI